MRVFPVLEGFLCGFLFGVILTLVVVLAARGKRSKGGELKGSPYNSDGSIPHTDNAAASAIGRETGGEVFDD